MQTRQFAMLLLATAAFASKSAPDIPVTTYLADYDAASAAYYLQNDGHGAYNNGVASVTSVLVANGYNHIVNGDWRLDIMASTIRTVGITFDTSNAVQPGDPGYTAPAEPPYWGIGFQAVRMENKCTMINRNMLTMRAGDKFTCPTIIRLPNITSSTYYRLYMGALFAPETQDVQVACNSTNTAGCSDWFIDPVPVVNADGSTSPGKARARLNLVDSRGSNNLTNKGDFYLTFHIHVTRP